MEEKRQQAQPTTQASVRIERTNPAERLTHSSKLTRQHPHGPRQAAVDRSQQLQLGHGQARRAEGDDLAARVHAGVGPTCCA